MNMKILIYCVLTGAISAACGGDSGSSGILDDGVKAKISEFEGLASLDKQDDNSWLLKWNPIEAEGLVYSIYKKSGESSEYDYDQPLISTQQNIYRYEPENIFTENITCFTVRVSNVAGDENLNSLCTTDIPLNFTGANSLERQSDGGYLLGWGALPVAGLVYTIYESKNNADYTFEEPSIDGLKDNFYKTPVIDRGDTYCYIVRYSHKDLDPDENLVAMCTEEEEELSFSGVSEVSKVSSSEAKITWNLSSSLEVDSYRVYSGSDFKEIVATVGATTSETTISNLASGNYSFGVRAVDKYGREDKNILSRAIVLE